MSSLKSNPNAKPTPADQKSYSDGVLDLANFVGEIMPSTDSVLAGLGGNLKDYQALLKDDQVSALIQQRMSALTSAEWEVVAGGEDKVDQDCADFIRSQLESANFEAARHKMHQGVLYGYSIAECLWRRDGANILLDGIKVRAPWRFGFAKDGTLKLKVGPQVHTMPERKFWVATWGAPDDDSPYGMGLGHQLWWPVYLKRNGARFWASFLDKFAIPATLSKYPTNGTDEDVNKRKKTALEACLALRSESAVAIPEGFEISLIEATSKGAGDFQAFLSYWDDAIAKVILSQTGTSKIGQYTGTAEVHQSVGATVIKNDADLLCESLNSGPVQWLSEWNFPSAKAPKVWLKFSDPAATAAQADLDVKISALGLRLTDDEIKRRYGEAWERGDTQYGVGGESSFAEGPDQTERLAEDEAAQWQEVLTPLKDQIQVLLDRCQTAEEFMARLGEITASPDLSALSERLTQATFAARVEGVLHGNDL